MDQRQIDRLRAAGGKVGLLSEVEWETLIERHGTDAVAFATVRAKQAFGRSVAVDEVAKHLPKGEAKPVRGLNAEYLDPVATAKEITDGAAIAAAEPPAPPAAALPTAAGGYQRVPWKVFRGLVQAKPGITAPELAALVGRDVDNVNAVLRHHREELVCDQDHPSAPRRWCLKGATMPPSGRAKAPQTEDPPAAAPAPPSVEIVTPEAQESPAVQPEIATPECERSPVQSQEAVTAESLQAPEANAECKPPKRRISKPSRALEPRPATLLRQEHFDGELLPLIEHVIDLWCLNHEIDLLVPCRGRLRKACAALFPEEL